MISDQPHLRDDYPRERTSILTWLLAAVIGAFVLELVLFSPWFNASDHVVRGIAVTPSGFSSGWLWTLVTHGLVHSPDNLFHVGIVLAGLFVLGRELEPRLGSKRLLGLIVGALGMGALMWLAVNWRSEGMLIGGTGAICALLVVYAALEPNREIRFLLFFYFPISLKPKHVTLTLLAVDLVALALSETMGKALPFNYAPSAHLGGMMVGWGYFRYLHPQRAPNRSNPRGATLVSPNGKMVVDGETQTTTSPAEKRAQLCAEVDRILDKISSHGLSSLSNAERCRLDEVKESMNRR